MSARHKKAIPTGIFNEDGEPAKHVKGPHPKNWTPRALRCRCEGKPAFRQGLCRECYLDRKGAAEAREIAARAYRKDAPKNHRGRTPLPATQVEPAPSTYTPKDGKLAFDRGIRARADEKRERKARRRAA